MMKYPKNIEDNIQVFEEFIEKILSVKMYKYMSREREPKLIFRHTFIYDEENHLTRLKVIFINAEIVTVWLELGHSNDSTDKLAVLSLINKFNLTHELPKFAYYSSDVIIITGSITYYTGEFNPVYIRELMSALLKVAKKITPDLLVSGLRIDKAEASN